MGSPSANPDRSFGRGGTGEELDIQDGTSLPNMPSFLPVRVTGRPFSFYPPLLIGIGQGKETG